MSALTFRNTGEGGTLLLLYLKTILLSLLTLGIYSFWGRAEIRRYLYSETWAGDDRFEFHGTGKELLLGWLRAAGVLLLLYANFFFLSLVDANWGPIAGGIILYVGILALMPVAIVGSVRYRLSRTSLRGIHFSSRATYGEFAKIYYKSLVLLIITLGFYAPWFANHVVGYLSRTSFYGDRPFSYDGEGEDLFKAYLLWLVLFIPTLYLISFWYMAKQQRYFWDHTVLGNARFHSTMRGRQILGISFTNALLVVFTLGIGTPWAILRWIRFQCAAVTLENFTGFEIVQQRAMAASATGEGVAALMDVDADAGGGFGL